MYEYTDSKFAILDIEAKISVAKAFAAHTNTHTHLGCTVEHVLCGHSKIDKTKINLTNGSLMKVKSIAECSHWSKLQYV